MEDELIAIAEPFFAEATRLRERASLAQKRPFGVIRAWILRLQADQTEELGYLALMTPSRCESSPPPAPVFIPILPM